MFTKYNLENGDKITLRSGDELIVYNSGYSFNDLHESNDNYLSDISDLYDDLTAFSDDKDDDVVKVERPTYTTVYVEKVKEMTVDEISKELGYTVKVIGGNN